MKSILDDIIEKLPETFNMMELHARAEDKTPYVLVALQEAERMNALTTEIRRSLKEVDLGLKVRGLTNHGRTSLNKGHLIVYKGHHMQSRYMQLRQS